MVGDYLVGDYQILESVGAGGMGVVYRARQRSLDRVVALKVIREDVAGTPEYRERFLREARLAASVDHPHVVTVHDVGETDRTLFLVLQWINGVDLRSLLEATRRLPPERAIAIATQLAEALDAVHGAGLVHRDVKPANVLLRQVANRDHAYLTDFGIARPKESTHQLTQTGWIVGTLGYLSPEQIKGHEPGPRSDLYALGCLFFETLTGRPPFLAENDMALRWAHASEPRPLVSAAIPELGSRYDQFISVALAIDPAQRFGSGREFAEALTAARAGGEQDSAALSRGAAVAHPPTAVGPPTPTPHAIHAPTPPPAYGVYAHGTSTPAHPEKSRSGNSLALILLALVAVVGVSTAALAATGAFSHRKASRTISSALTPHVLKREGKSSGPPTTPTTAGAAVSSTPSAGTSPSAGATATYNGADFSVAYPSGWHILDAEQNRGSYTDTTIVSPSDSDILLRVDFSQTPPNSNPMKGAQPEIRALESQPGYQQLELRSGRFHGFPAVRWRFTDIESGVSLEKEDLFFITGNGLGFGILTQAPAGQYAALAPEFAALRQTLVVK